MPAIYLFALDTVAMIAALGIALAVLLLLWHARRPAWLKRDSSDTLLSIVVALAVLAAFGCETAGLMQIGLSGEAAILTAPVACAVAAWLIWRGFDGRRRMAMAEAGASPFGRLAAGSRQELDRDLNQPAG